MQQEQDTHVRNKLTNHWNTLIRFHADFVVWRSSVKRQNNFHQKNFLHETWAAILYHFRLQIPWVQGQRKSWVRAEVFICTVASMCSVVHLCTVAHRGHATFFLSRNKIKTSRDKWKLSRDNFIIYRAINGKHGGSRNRLSRTLFPWTTMTATVEEVCFEVNSSFYLSKKII